jgi:putative peptidoglycan lipid II flippase
MTLNTPAIADEPEPSMPRSADAAQKQEETNARIAGATGILALGNIASRVLGLAREMVLTFLFGASSVVDAFQVATVVIRAIYDLLIGGHVNGAFVPVLTEIVSVQGREALWRVLNILMSVVLTLMTGLVIVVYLFAPQIVSITASGADEQTLALAASLLRFTAPALIFLGLFAIFSASLYALKRFMLPAFAGVIFNGSIALLTLALTPPLQIETTLFDYPTSFDAILRPFSVARPESGIAAVAVGWFVGALLQMAMQLFGLKGARLRFTVRWRHPALRAIALLYAPVMLSLILDTLVARPYSYNLASRTGEGSIAYMNWATTLIQFPQGLVATAISVAILPTLAGQAANLVDTLERAFKDTLGLGMRLTITLILPATAGLMVLAVPIIQLLFQHGAFTAADTVVTSTALRLYLIGLPFAAIDLLIVYAFYARKDTLTPTLVGLFSLVIYMITADLLLPRFGLYSLMIADSVKHIVHALISIAILWRRLGGFGDQRLVSTTARAGVAALVMALVARALLPLLYQHIGTGNLVSETVFVTIAGSASLVTFISMAYLLGIHEIRWLSRLVKNRLERR